MTTSLVAKRPHRARILSLTRRDIYARTPSSISSGLVAVRVVKFTIQLCTRRSICPTAHMGHCSLSAMVAVIESSAVASTRLVLVAVWIHQGLECWKIYSSVQIHRILYSTRSKCQLRFAFAAFDAGHHQPQCCTRTPIAAVGRSAMANGGRRSNWAPQPPLQHLSAWQLALATTAADWSRTSIFWPQGRGRAICVVPLAA